MIKQIIVNIAFEKFNMRYSIAKYKYKQKLKDVTEFLRIKRAKIISQFVEIEPKNWNPNIGKWQTDYIILKTIKL